MQSIPDLTSFFLGHVHTIDDAGAASAFRCTPVQMEHYRPVPAWWDRCHCGAGVRFAMQTSATIVELDLVFDHWVRDWATLDLEVDGLICDTQTFDRFGERRCRFDLPKNGEVHKVSIHLPLTCQASVAGMHVDADAAALASSPVGYLALGDSITQGMLALGPSRSYAMTLARLLGVNLLNQGIGAHIWDTDAIATDLEIEPRFITIAYGTNDWGTGQTLERTQEQVSASCRKLKDRWPDADLSVITPIYRSMKKEDEVTPLARYREVIAEAAGSVPGTRVIDGLAIMPNLDEMFNGDDTHPGDNGMAHMAAGILKAIKG